MAAEIHQEGLQFLLELLSARQSLPANFYLGLATDASLAENATLASLTEVSGTGYARIAIEPTAVGFPTSEATGTNDWRTIAKQVTFTGGAGGWTGANTAFLCTVSSGTAGKLLASFPLAATRTLQQGDTEKVTMTLELDG